MVELHEVISRARAYAVRSGKSPATVSRILFGNGTRLEQIESGKSSLRVDTLQKVQEKLTDLEAAA